MEKFDESTKILNDWVRKQRNFVDGVQLLIEKLDELNKIRDYSEQFWKGTKEKMEEGVSIITQGSQTLNSQLTSLDRQFYNRLGATLAELDNWMSVSDLMTGLMVIFLFIAIAYISRVKQNQTVLTDYIETKNELHNKLVNEFAGDTLQWQMAIGKDLSMKFKEPTVLFASDTSTSYLMIVCVQTFEKFVSKDIQIMCQCLVMIQTPILPMSFYLKSVHLVF